MKRRLIVVGWLVLLLGAVLTSVLVFDLDEDLGAFLPPGSTPLDTILLEQIRHAAAGRLILTAFEGGTASGRAAASREARVRLEDVAGLARVQNGEAPLDLGAFAPLEPYRYLLTAPGPFDTAGLRQALEDRLDELRSPLGPLIGGNVAEDPTARMRALASTWRAGEGPPREAGIWVSVDGSKSLLLIEIASAGTQLEDQTRVVDAVQTLLDSVAAEHAVAAVLSGAPVIQVTTRDAMRAEVTRLSVTASALVILLVLVVFRSPAVLALVTVPLASGLAAGLAATLAVFGAIHGIALAFSVTLLGVAVDYPLHLYGHAQAGRSLEQTAARVWPPMLVGLLTTVAAFGGLATSGIEGLVQIALVTSVGLVVAALCTRHVLPALAPQPRGLPEPVTNRLGQIRLPGLRAPVAAIVAIAALILVANGGRAFENDLGALNPAPTAVRARDAELRRALGAPDLRHAIVVRGRDGEAVLVTVEHIAKRLDTLVDAGALGGYQAISRLLPSRARQEARLAGLPPPEALERTLDQATAGLPFRPGAFAPFVRDVEATRSGGPLDIARGQELLDATPAGVHARRLLLHAGQDWTAMIPLTDVRDPAALEAMVMVPGLDAEVVFADLRQTAGDLLVGVRDAALVRLALGGLAVVVLVTILSRRPWPGLQVALALTGALVVTAAILVMLGQRLSLFHVFGGLLVFGLGADYALFTMLRSHRQGEGARTRATLVICATSTCIVFGVLATSETAILRALGLTVTLGTVLAWLACAAMVDPVHDVTGRHGTWSR